MATQLIAPNTGIACKPGWCLQYVQDAFGVVGGPGYRWAGSATQAWNQSPTQHPDWNFPSGVAHPVWFELANEPAGHVAIRMPDGTVFSTSDLGNTAHHHSSMADLMGYYAYYGMPLTYLGWTEDVENVQVLSLISPDSVPTPQKDWFELADENTLKDALRSVLTEPAVLDMIALAILKRDCYIVDPSGQTGNVIPGQTTNLAKKINWMAHNDAQLLTAITNVGQKVDALKPVVPVTAATIPAPTTDTPTTGVTQ